MAQSNACQASGYVITIDADMPFGKSKACQQFKITLD